MTGLAEEALRGQAGVVRAVAGGACSVFLPHDDRVVTLPAAHLAPLVPQSGDRVKVGTTTLRQIVPCIRT